MREVVCVPTSSVVMMLLVGILDVMLVLSIVRRCGCGRSIGAGLTCHITFARLENVLMALLLLLLMAMMSMMLLLRRRLFTVTLASAVLTIAADDGALPLLLLWDS